MERIDGLSSGVSWPIGWLASIEGPARPGEAPAGLDTERMFMDWLLCPAERKCTELRDFIGSKGDCDGDWFDVARYLNLIPESATEAERRLFICDMEAVLAIVRNELAPERQGRSRCRVERLLTNAEAVDLSSLKVLSEGLGISAARLGAAFKARTGLSFRRHLTILRVRIAVKYLSNPLRSVKKVASLAGYGDVSKLVRDFHDLLRTTPGEFQKTLARRTADDGA